MPVELKNNQQESPEEQYQIRVEKIKKMNELGVDAWPSFKPTNAISSDVINEFVDEQASRVYDIAGRVITMRKHGKAAFVTIQDGAGRIQVYVRRCCWRASF